VNFIWAHYNKSGLLLSSLTLCTQQFLLVWVIIDFYLPYVNPVLISNHAGFSLFFHFPESHLPAVFSPVEPVTGGTFHGLVKIWLFQSKDLARVQDVVGVKGLLNPFHQGYFVFAQGYGEVNALGKAEAVFA
jgi:hypothetical protein